MRKTIIFLILSFVISFLLIPSACFAQQPPPSQQMSGEIRTRELEAEDRALRKEIETKKKKPQVEEPQAPKASAAGLAEKILIKKINVAGATFIPQKTIDDIVLPFENKELSLKEMQAIADQITDAYRKKGYLTSRAYLPPQKIESGTLKIRIVEGRMGSLEVKGNYHYKTFLFKKKFQALPKGKPFDFGILTRIMRRINAQPDRSSRAVLMPGKEPGQTDVLLEVKDNLPVHVGFDFDNYASSYLFYNRYQISVIDNNLFGFEDILNLRCSLNEGQSYESYSGSYLLPASETMKIGLYGSTGRLHLIKNAKPFEIYGKSRLWGINAAHSVVDYENATFNVGYGFDYKDIFNYQLNNESSRDRMRVAKAGFDMDITDIVGRTLITNEIDIGLPEFMAGLKAKDPRASRAGSGGEFIKYVANLLRLQQMPYQSNILCSNHLQISNKPLTSTEEFQLGGIANLRGYPPAEFVGDNGFTTSVEWSFPFYPIPRDIKMPFSQATFYNAIRIVAFYDYGAVWLRKPLPTEKKWNQLSDAGWGIRFNLPKFITLRMDFAWALDRKPSDGHPRRTWLQVSTKF
jgi:hemolysin activation/secretion protein